MSRSRSLDGLDPALRTALTPLLDDLIASYPTTLRSVCLYGSGATADFVHRRSNLNCLVVLERVDLPALRQAAVHWPRWRALGVIAPLLLTLDQIRSSLDVFPLEYLEMKARHLCLHGEDPLIDLTFTPSAVRQQCERELRGKLITLREGFIETGHDSKALESLLLRAFSALQRILLGLVWLNRRSLPSTRKELFSLIEEIFRIPTEPFRSLDGLKRGTARLSSAELEELFGQLHDSLDRLTQAVDQMIPS